MTSQETLFLTLKNCFSQANLYKKGESTDAQNCRPVSILNCFSKANEKFLNKQLLPFVNDWKFMPAYRNDALDTDSFTGVVIMAEAATRGVL